MPLPRLRITMAAVLLLTLLGMLTSVTSVQRQPVMYFPFYFQKS